MRLSPSLLTLDAARERRRAERSRLLALICAILCILGSAAIFYHAGFDAGADHAIRAMRGGR